MVTLRRNAGTLMIQISWFTDARGVICTIGYWSPLVIQLVTRITVRMILPSIRCVAIGLKIVKMKL